MIICIVALCVQCTLYSVHCTCLYLSHSHGVLRFDSMSILVSVLCWSPGWYSRIKLGRMYNILVRRGIVVLCAVLGSVSILVSQGARARATASPAALRGLGMSSLGKCWCSLSIVANNFSKNTHAINTTNTTNNAFPGLGKSPYVDACLRCCLFLIYQTANFS